MSSETKKPTIELREVVPNSIEKINAELLEALIDIKKSYPETWATIAYSIRYSAEIAIKNATA